MYGGTASVMMGGSFADGASNAARIMLMNEMGNVVIDWLTKMAMQGGGKYVTAEYATKEAMGYDVKVTDADRLAVGKGALTIVGGAALVGVSGAGVAGMALGYFVYQMEPTGTNFMGFVWDTVLMRGTARFLPDNQQNALEISGYALQQMQ